MFPSQNTLGGGNGLAMIPAVSGPTTGQAIGYDRYREPFSYALAKERGYPSTVPGVQLAMTENLERYRFLNSLHHQDVHQRAVSEANMVRQAVAGMPRYQMGPGNYGYNPRDNALAYAESATWKANSWQNKWANPGNPGLYQGHAYASAMASPYAFGNVHVGPSAYRAPGVPPGPTLMQLAPVANQGMYPPYHPPYHPGDTYYTEPYPNYSSPYHFVHAAYPEAQHPYSTGSSMDEGRVPGAVQPSVASGDKDLKWVNTALLTAILLLLVFKD